MKEKEQEEENSFLPLNTKPVFYLKKGEKKASALKHISRNDTSAFTNNNG